MKTSKEFKESLDNVPWNQKYIDAIRELFPETWTHPQNLNVTKIAFGLKLNGIDWRTDEDFGAFIVLAKKIGLIEIDTINLVRRGRDEIYSRTRTYH